MKQVAWAAALAALATLPLWVGNEYYVNIATQILLYAIFALGLNVLVGYAGLVSLGHAGCSASPRMPGRWQSTAAATISSRSSRRSWLPSPSPLHSQCWRCAGPVSLL